MRGTLKCRSSFALAVGRQRSRAVGCLHCGAGRARSCLPRQADPRHAPLCVCVSTGKGTYSQRISDYFGCVCTRACGCCLWVLLVGAACHPWASPLSLAVTRYGWGRAPNLRRLPAHRLQVSSVAYCHKADGSLVMAVCACRLPIKQADQHHHGRPAAQRDAGGQPAGPRGKAGCCPSVPCAAKLTSCCLRAS